MTERTIGAKSTSHCTSAVEEDAIVGDIAMNEDIVCLQYFGQGTCASVRYPILAEIQLSQRDIVQHSTAQNPQLVIVDQIITDVQMRQDFCTFQDS